MNAIVTYNVPHMVEPWGMLIVVHFFLSGLAGGSFITSAAASFFNEERYKKTAIVASYLALLAILIDVPILIADLDRPERFFTLLFRGSMTAPLTWGTWFLIGLGLFSVLNIMLKMGNPAVKGSKGIILGLGSVFALGVCTYTAVALNIATDARPLWSNGILIPIFIAASGITAIATTSLIISLGGEGKEELSCLSSTNAGLLILQLIMVISLILTTLTGTPMSRQAATVITSGDMAMLFWGGLIVVGLLIPIFLLWSSFIAKKEGRISPGIAALASVLVLIGVFALRYIIVSGGQMLPLT
ncbi:MAG: polysulfide reductase NrfD [Deltaproteobacteria bacterium]|nr:polysulfide reductase NrfD [Deltaproteobacteria bacterium]